MDGLGTACTLSLKIQPCQRGWSLDVNLFSAERSSVFSSYINTSITSRPRMQYCLIHPSHAIGPMYYPVTPGMLPVMPSAMPKRMRNANVDYPASSTAAAVDTLYAYFRELYDSASGVSSAKQMRTLEAKLTQRRAEIEQMMRHLRGEMDEMQQTVMAKLAEMANGDVTESDSEGDVTESDSEEELDNPDPVDNKYKNYEKIASHLVFKNGYRQKRRDKIQRTQQDYASHNAAHYKQLPTDNSSLFEIACKLAKKTMKVQRVKKMQTQCQILIVYNTLADLERDLNKHLPTFDKTIQQTPGTGDPEENQFQVTMALEPLPVFGKYQKTWTEKGVDNFARFDAESPALHRLVCTHQGVLNEVNSNVAASFKVSMKKMHNENDVRLYLQNFYDLVLLDLRQKTQKDKSARKEIDTVAMLKHYVEVRVASEAQRQETMAAAKPESSQGSQDTFSEPLDDDSSETQESDGLTAVTLTVIDDDDHQVQLSLTGDDGAVQFTVSQTGQSEPLQMVVFKTYAITTSGIDVTIIANTGKRFATTISSKDQAQIYAFFARFGTFKQDEGGFINWRPHNLV